MPITHIRVMAMNRAFFSAYALMYYERAPEWSEWCGGGPLDNPNLG